MACLKDVGWQLALGLLAETAESTGQHNAIAASLAIVPGKDEQWQLALRPAGRDG